MKYHQNIIQHSTLQYIVSNFCDINMFPCACKLVIVFKVVQQVELLLSVSVSLEEGLCDGLLAEEVIDVGDQDAAVPVVGHVTSVVDPGDEVLEGVPGNLLVLVQVEAQQTLAHLEGQ